MKKEYVAPFCILLVVQVFGWWYGIVVVVGTFSWCE